MASAFSHAFIAIAICKTYTGAARPLRFWVLAALCAVVPDADVVGFAFGISYGDMMGHRGLTHSLLFALVLGFMVVALAFREVPRWTRAWWTLGACFFVVTASHGVLDALTNGGLGVAFFAPFSSARYFWPWRPVEVSPIGVAPFFSARGLTVIASELVWLWLPGAALMSCAWAYRRLKGQGAGGKT
ncbi:MAG TPA: metal-dependent hydrolase [Pyrinomonadaceae bacterium]|nr:metal-dependent hydrolase [Pyrinomonadaceae bacterium]